ncbi:2-octaprenyl-6-methoxyphenyl hydroxylase [Thalassotalea sp. LPB0316]|uniref:2-octaprenyl-6-methoxyphenyl hydroxylase n=1 Tax=Thalassotalea sp. LPB0316 TaxID=2769490 RepID=UPI001867A53F|nr:2-octaprenyl-6-methoxyphenyl hydroxylase [Thalassotalea sp. LPB0316]QOL25675.1 2-octaprenyl-6-methoxyphenyl hydroxylase [Thalassotalea sp. LPB0316]
MNKVSENSAFDIVISGGGLSGALTALSLSQLTKANGEALNIAIVENAPINTTPSLNFDDRVLALSHQSVSYLAQLNVWQHMKSAATPIETIHISDKGNYGKARIYAQEHNVSALGVVIEMALIGKAIHQELSQYDNISWFCPNSIANVEYQAQDVAITLDDKKVVMTKLLLGCDGGHSVVRQAAGITTTAKSYQQSALIANVSTAKKHDNVAYERFTTNGPLAMLPLSKDRCSLVWTLPPERAEQIQQLDEQSLKYALYEEFGPWLGEITQVGERFVYPLHLIQATEQVSHRTILIGNASHTIHPIAGQGFNLGLRDTKDLATAITKALDNDQDIGGLTLIQNYQAQRRQDHQQVIGLTDSLVTLFSNELPPLIAGRNIGLKALNYMNCIKHPFVAKTMGY